MRTTRATPAGLVCLNSSSGVKDRGCMSSFFQLAPEDAQSLDAAVGPAVVQTALPAARAELGRLPHLAAADRAAMAPDARWHRLTSPLPRPGQPGQGHLRYQRLLGGGRLDGTTR